MITKQSSSLDLIKTILPASIDIEDRAMIEQIIDTISILQGVFTAVGQGVRESAEAIELLGTIDYNKDFASIWSVLLPTEQDIAARSFVKLSPTGFVVPSTGFSFDRQPAPCVGYVKDFTPASENALVQFKGLIKVNQVLTPGVSYNTTSSGALVAAIKGTSGYGTDAGVYNMSVGMAITEDVLFLDCIYSTHGATIADLTAPF